MSSPHFRHQTLSKSQPKCNLAKSSAEISFSLFTPGFFCSGIKYRAFVLFWLQQHGFCFVPASTKMTTSPWNTKHQVGHLYTPGTYQSSLIEVLSDDFNYQHQHQESEALSCKCLVTTPAGTLWLLSSQQRCIATCNETSTLPDERSTLQPHWHCQTQCAFSSSLECSSKETVFCPKGLVHQRSTFDICFVSWSIMTLLHPWTRR